MARPIEFATPDQLEYQFHPNNSGFQQFRVRTSNDAHIALTSGPGESDPMYEIFIGGWENQKSVIRKNRTKPDVAEVQTPGIVHPGEFRGFWIRWGNQQVSAGREGEAEPFIVFNDNENVPINYIGFCTGWGASGNWIVEQPYAAPACAMQQGLCWIPASNGQVPPAALAGGEDNGQPLYVIRASCNGGLIPGKLVPSHGQAYVPWGGVENPCADYEVLCNCGGNWVATAEDRIPANAVSAGMSEQGEPLFVGRVVHNGCLTVGKVQPSHKVCYIPYGGQELGFPEYEILVQ